MFLLETEEGSVGSWL